MRSWVSSVSPHALEDTILVPEVPDLTEIVVGISPVTKDRLAITLTSLYACLPLISEFFVKNI